jgi:hypothetical protein
MEAGKQKTATGLNAPGEEGQNKNLGFAPERGATLIDVYTSF